VARRHQPLSVIVYVSRAPRELRHSFVSILSDNGVTIEAIADLVGHRTTIVTQKVYRHQLKPVITTGATTMNTIFKPRKEAKTA
jgi:integrase